MSAHSISKREEEGGPMLHNDVSNLQHTHTHIHTQSNTSLRLDILNLDNTIPLAVLMCQSNCKKLL